MRVKFGFAAALVVVLFGAAAWLRFAPHNEDVSSNAVCSTACEDEISPQDARLADDLFVQQKANENSFVVSPEGIRQITSLLRNAASPDVSEQLGRLASNSPASVGIDNARSEFARASLAGNDAITFANHVLTSQDTQIAPQLQRLLLQYYGVVPQTLNFGNPEDRKRVDSEVSQWFGGQVLPLHFPSSTRFAIVNAASFHARWKNGFDVAKTTQVIFHGSTRGYKVAMMSRGLTIPYYEDGQVQIVSLELSSSLELLFLLPKTHFEEVTGAGPFGKLLSATLIPAHVFVQIPRFASNGNLSCRSMFEQNGLGSLFSDPSSLPHLLTTGGAALSDVFAAFRIVVDEAGASGASATVAINDWGVQQTPSSIKQFVANRPFYYGVVDRKTRVLYFAGIFKHP